MAAKELILHIDELGRIQAELARLRLIEGRANWLKDRIREQVALQDWPLDQPIMLEGKTYSALVGAAARLRTVDKPAAFKALGKAAFLENCSISLQNLEALLAPDAARLIITPSPEPGPRTVKTLLRAGSLNTQA